MMIGWTMGLDGWLWMGAWIAALAGMVWLLVRTPARRSERDEALEVLRARLARGEITPDEFERARSLLDIEIPRRNTP
jgi:uncharacterized membrane protein